MAERYTMYVIGYDPPDMPMDKVARVDIQRMIAAADCCVTWEPGFQVGDTFDAFNLVPGRNGKSPKDGTTLRAVEVRYFGKLVVFEEVK